ncbi:hypothetical protein ONS95_004088 [Cadophora gregata]|uniref:uncharacterized protein n=2 Tax=Cadophora gregata TaxID=51156 RepID=UPI0026DA749B|nr:uncharacterized protein ONS95_005242 [Cadophora gregata]XP_058352156.1 uncharacterized protein ONS95_004088 [Cadophora gregata]KAK0103208.1 hypothetical protein ONS95_005242 [Cadophora gregata]KAK0105555.1 hypothetical protein ONS95_004088 [Cadophora gregata]
MPFECPACKNEYIDILDHIRKKHPTDSFTELQLQPIGLVPCPTCATACKGAHGIKTHSAKIHGITGSSRVSTQHRIHTTPSASAPLDAEIDDSIGTPYPVIDFPQLLAPFRAATPKARASLGLSGSEYPTAPGATGLYKSPPAPTSRNLSTPPPLPSPPFDIYPGFTGSPSPVTSAPNSPKSPTYAQVTATPLGSKPSAPTGSKHPTASGSKTPVPSVPTGSKHPTAPGSKYPAPSAPAGSKTPAPSAPTGSKHPTAPGSKYPAPSAPAGSKHPTAPGSKYPAPSTPTGSKHPTPSGSKYPAPSAPTGSKTPVPSVPTGSKYPTALGPDLPTGTRRIQTPRGIWYSIPGEVDAILPAYDGPTGPEPDSLPGSRPPTPTGSTSPTYAQIVATGYIPPKPSTKRPARTPSPGAQRPTTRQKIGPTQPIEPIIKDSSSDEDLYSASTAPSSPTPSFEDAISTPIPTTPTDKTPTTPSLPSDSPYFPRLSRLFSPNNPYNTPTLQNYHNSPTL